MPGFSGRCFMYFNCRIWAVHFQSNPPVFLPWPNFIGSTQVDNPNHKVDLSAFKTSKHQSIFLKLKSMLSVWDREMGEQYHFMCKDL